MSGGCYRLRNTVVVMERTAYSGSEQPAWPTACATTSHLRRSSHAQPQRLNVTYEIRVEGHLDSHWADWFGATTIAQADDGDTVLTCTVADQAALHGLLKKARDSGLLLIAVNPIAQPRRTKETSS